MRILAFDPGARNFAWVLFDGAVIDSGWVTPLDSVGDDAAFLNCCIELLTRTRPAYVIAERFTVRNRGQSVHAETINQMLGRLAILARLHAGTDLVQVMASTWKTWFQRRKENWEETYASLPSVHQRDAAGIAQYLSATLAG